MFIYVCVSILNLTYLKIYTWKRYLEIIHISWTFRSRLGLPRLFIITGY